MNSGPSERLEVLVRRVPDTDLICARPVVQRVLDNTELICAQPVRAELCAAGPSLSNADPPSGPHYGTALAAIRYASAPSSPKFRTRSPNFQLEPPSNMPLFPALPRHFPPLLSALQ